MSVVKPKPELVIQANHKEQRQSSKPIESQSKYL